MKTLSHAVVAVMLILFAAACSKTSETELLDLVGDDASVIAIVNVDEILTDQGITMADIENSGLVDVAAADAGTLKTGLLISYGGDKAGAVLVPKNMADAVAELKNGGTVTKVGEKMVINLGQGTYYMIDEDNNLIWMVEASDPQQAINQVSALQTSANKPLAPWKRNYLAESGKAGMLLNANNGVLGAQLNLDKNKLHLSANIFHADGTDYNILEGTDYATLGECGMEMPVDANIVWLSGRMDVEKYMEGVMALLPDQYKNNSFINNAKSNLYAVQSSLFARITAKDVYNTQNIRAQMDATYKSLDIASDVMDMLLRASESVGARVVRNGAEATVSMPSLFQAVLAVKSNTLSINLNNADFSSRSPLPGTAAESLSWVHIGVDKTLMGLVLPAGNVSGVELDIYMFPSRLDMDVRLTDSDRTLLQFLKR